MLEALRKLGGESIKLNGIAVFIRKKTGDLFNKLKVYRMLDRLKKPRYKRID